MNRRRFVTLGAVGAAGTVLTGCITDEMGLGVSNQNSNETTGSAAAGSDTDPEEIVEEFIDAIDAGDHDTIALLVHSNSELANEVDTLAEGGEALAIKSVRTETVAQAGEEAYVDVELEYRNEDGENSTDNSLYELRKENGEWRILGETSNVPIEYRLEAVSPADSFMTAIGLSESVAEPFFRAEDVSSVGIQEYHQNNDLIIVGVSFSEDRARQIQENATDLGGDLSEAKIFEYLDDERTKTSEISAGLAQAMEAEQWAQQRSFNLIYEDEELAERVAATIQEQVNG